MRVKLIELINQFLSQSRVTLTSLPLNLALSMVFTAAAADSLVSNPMVPLPFDLPFSSSTVQNFTRPKSLKAFLS